MPGWCPGCVAEWGPPVAAGRRGSSTRNGQVLSEGLHLGPVVAAVAPEGEDVGELDQRAVGLPDAVLEPPGHRLGVDVQEPRYRACRHINLAVKGEQAERHGDEGRVVPDSVAGRVADPAQDGAHRILQTYGLVA